ncbi:MAG: hypothetical protein ACKVHE_03925 [Planctomycetales bacterium]
MLSFVERPSGNHKPAFGRIRSHCKTIRKPAATCATSRSDMGTPEEAAKAEKDSYHSTQALLRSMHD